MLGWLGWLLPVGINTGHAPQGLARRQLLSSVRGVVWSYLGVEEAEAFK